MKNFYNDQEAASFIKKYPDLPEELCLRIYTSRLTGKDRNLILHGGGNTSVKLKHKNIFGKEENVLYVKGSGADLLSIEPEEFVGLNIDPLKKLLKFNELSDKDMENQLQRSRIDCRGPAPSVEALVHLFLPHKFIDHTHADSILSLTNLKNGMDVIKKALGNKAAVIPYIMSGFPLAKAVFKEFEKKTEIEAVVVQNHGIFTFAESARKSYELMTGYVSLAEKYIRKHAKRKASDLTPIEINENNEFNISTFAQAIRGACAHITDDGFFRRYYVETRTSPELINISVSKEAAEFCMSGVLTPDHVIRTKNRILYLEYMPESLDDMKNYVEKKVEDFKKDYRSYFKKQTEKIKKNFVLLDTCPRIFLIANRGIVALGSTINDAVVNADIAEHTLLAKFNSWTVGKYAPISDSHIFDMEYWGFQQRKVAKQNHTSLHGQIALVTGAGGAIGFGIAKQLLAAGAVVVLSDIDQDRLKKIKAILSEKFNKTDIETLLFDVTDFHEVRKAFNEICRRFGGIDLVVPNAGIAHVARIEDLETEKFDQVNAVNLKGTFNVIKASIPVFRLQGSGGNIVLISSKNVFDPGAAFGAYSASKAGAHQIAKIAALELAELGVRVNMINPDAVFGEGDITSKLWDLIGPDRMKSRGLDSEGLKEHYRQRNLLKTRVSAEHVGNAVVFFAGNKTPTTGASLPVDGGIPGAFPR